jgi:hypothetical protein
MSRPEFENQTLISAMTNKTIVVIRGETEEFLAIGAWQRITILSPPNTVSRLFNCRLSWDADGRATAGTKSIILDQQIDEFEGIGLFLFNGPYNLGFSWDQGHWINTTSQTPNDFGAMSTQIQAARFDEFKGIQLVFTHSTNVNEVSKRHWVLFVEREVVAR